MRKTLDMIGEEPPVKARKLPRGKLGSFMKILLQMKRPVTATGVGGEIGHTEDVARKYILALVGRRYVGRAYRNDGVGGFRYALSPRGVEIIEKQSPRDICRNGGKGMVRSA
jgi:hypothetical protein